MEIVIISESIRPIFSIYGTDARHFVENVFCRKCCNFKNFEIYSVED